MKRTAKKGTSEKGVIGEGPNLYLFRYYSVVDPSDYPENFTIQVRGASRRDALAYFREKFEESDYNVLEIKDIEITDNNAARAQAQASAQAQVGAQASAQASGVYRMTDNNGGYLSSIRGADNPMAATIEAMRRANAAGLTQGTWRLMAPGGRQLYPDPSDNIPEIPGEFVADPMVDARTYIIKYSDPQGQMQQTAIDANSAQQAKEWFQSNHPRSYIVTDVYRHTG
jgi:hypothetical protein